MPTAFIWPERAHRKHFKNGSFECEVVRYRPPNTTGPMSTWINGDYWSLNRHLGPSRSSYEADIYAKKEALNDALYRNSPEYEAQSKKWWAAREDDKFQALKTLLMGERKPGRGRPSEVAKSAP